MTQNISGYGLVVRVVADISFPLGFDVTQFADDADPLDMTSIQIMDKAMGLNGDLIVWSKANPLPAVLNVIPGGDDDRNLSILAENNRAGKGKSPVGDSISMTVIYPDGSQITLSEGALTDAMFGKSVASQGRQKTKAYAFAFQNKTGV